MPDIQTELADLELVVDDAPPPPGLPPIPSGPQLGPERILPDEGRSGPGRRPGPSGLRGVWLVIALTVAVLGLAVPLFSVWWGMVVWLYASVAELLQHTGGLDRGMFESARMWAAIVNAAALGWCLLRLVRRWRDPERRTWGPIVGLWWVYCLALWILIPIDLVGPWNINDPLTTFLLVGGAMLMGPVLSALFLVLLLRALQMAWQRGRESVAGHIRVAAGATLIGVSALSGTAVLIIGATEGYVGVLDQDIGVEDDIDAMMTLDREWYVSASGSLNTTGRGYGDAPDRPTMVDCHRELTNFGFVGDTPLIRAVRRAQRKGLSEADALDLAWDTMTEVCAHFARSGVADLHAYYGRSVENALNRRYKRRFRDDEIAEAIRRTRLRDGGRWGPEPERRRRIRQVLDLLSADDRRILELSIVEGYDHREIGRRLRKSTNAVAQALHRARKRFIALCDALDCRESG